MGADNAVGDIYDIDIILEEGEYTAWLVNQFNKRVGYFDKDFSKKLALFSADGLVEKAILSFIALKDNVEESDDGKSVVRGTYWGNVAVICYSPAESAAFETFIANVAAKIADDVRPKIDLGDEVAKNVVATKGQWLPTQNAVLPDNDKTLRYIKRRRKATEKLVDQGRAGNKGCYVLSWAFIIAVIAVIAFAVKSCLGL